MIRIRVLGAMQASIAQAEGPPVPIDLGGPRQRAVLALLLVARGDVVPVDQLIDDLWRGEPPPRALGALQAYVSNLRRLLEPERAPRAVARVLVSRAPGYALRLDDEQVDARRFEAEVTAARILADPARRRRALDTALARWSGSAYAEFATEQWAAPEIARLEELRLGARELLAAAALDAGDPAAAGAEAETLAHEQPLREEGWRLLALARYTAGRQADALSALRRARRLFADELGIDPGPALAQLESDILAQRITIRPSTPAPAPSAPARASTALSEPPDFVGRADELRVLRAAATGVTTDASRTAIISGESGSGKSALLQRFRQELESEGWRVAVGRCPEAEGAPPAWAWVEALRALADEFELGRHADTLAPLLDDAVAGSANSDRTRARFRLHRGVADYLVEAAQQGPLAVFLDDLHRADAETLALLDAVVASSGILLAVAYRPDEVDGQLDATLASLATPARARIRLAGLNSDDAAELVRAVAGREPNRSTLDALTERTGGNPFYLRESARLLSSEGELVAISEVPEGVRDVLRRRFARLPELSVAVLRLAAVVGRESDVDLLLQAAEVDEDAVLDAVEAGVLAGLLDEPAAGRVRFTHALVRDTLFGDLSRVRRGRWHLRVARALELLRPQDVSALAYHFGESLSAGTARVAANYARAAARQAEARFAHDAAAGFYERAATALDRMPGAGVVPETVDILCSASRSHRANGDVGAARAARSRAVTLAADAGDQDLVVRALTAWTTPTAWLTRAYGEVDEQIVGLLETCLRTAELDSAARCRLLISLADEVGGERAERAREASSEAERLAAGQDDPHLLGLAVHARLSAYDPRMTVAERTERAETLVGIADRHDVPSYGMIGRYFAMQAAAAVGDLPTMRNQLEITASLADRYQWRQMQAVISMARGFVAHAEGDLDAAEQHYLTGHAAFVRYGELGTDAILVIAAFTLRRTQHRLAELAPMLRELDTAARDTVIDPIALALVAAGDVEGARTTRSRAQPIRADFMHSLLLSLRGEAVVGTRAVDQARQAYRDLHPYRGQIAGGTTASWAAGPVDTVLGDLAALLDDPIAADHYRSALVLARACGCPQWITDAQDRLRD